MTLYYIRRIDTGEYYSFDLRWCKKKSRAFQFGSEVIHDRIKILRKPTDKKILPIPVTFEPVK